MITLKSHAKINVTLDIKGRREDGYHLLRTVMQTVTLCDIVTMTEKPHGISVSCNLRYIPTDGRNIVYKVAKAFFDYFGIDGGIDIRLKKHIPCGSGLGGGSSNGAAVLEGLCRLYGISLSPGQKVKLTENIGADIPFFFYGGTALCEGIGEQVTPLSAMPECWIVITKPRFSLSTSEAFSSPLIARAYGADSTNLVISSLKSGKSANVVFSGAQNALESASISLCPAIARLKELMLKNGAFFSMMSGSGSSVYGVFDSHKAASDAFGLIRSQYPNTYITKPCPNAVEFI